MLTCEEFERSYLEWQTGRASPELEALIRAHLATCSFCSSLSQETAGLITTLRSLPRREPSPGFESRLNQRVQAADRARAPRRRISPHWTALGAGLATGMAVGLVFLLPRSVDETPPASPAMPLPGLIAEEGSPATDTVARTTDSLKLPEYRYNPDRHSTVVSSGR